jgi:hypothetical protein
VTGVPPPRRAIVLTHPVEAGAVLARAIQADGYLGAAKLSQPDGIGQVSAAATNERSNRR